jgi:FKBP-type peptidyl-prolyl cis-trans isomerase
MTFCACDSVSQQRVKLKTKQDSVSYAIGVLNGKNMKQQELDLDVNLMTAGMKDAMSAEGKALLTEEQIQGIIMRFQNEAMLKQQEKMMKKADDNKKKGEEFLAANKTKAGVKTTASGLQYMVLKAGDGRSPVDSSQVKVHYRGTLIDGTEFDSSYKRGQPAEFPVNGLIKGWQEALKLMKIGDKLQLFVPAELGYGMNAPPNIGPNQVLIFEMELLDIMK